MDASRWITAGNGKHSKARNRLGNKTVTSLVYCYVNLRLVKKMEKEEKGETFDEDDNLEDFLYSSMTAAGDGDGDCE